MLVRSDFGLVMKSIRDNERRVRFFGTNVELVKISVFVLGAVLAAGAGGVYATIVGFVSAPLFGFLFSTQILIWVAVGGRGTILGPVIGAIGLSFVTNKLSASYPTEWSLFLGLLFVAVVVFVPDGVLPPAVRQVRRVLLRRWPARRPACSSLRRGRGRSCGSGGADHGRLRGAVLLRRARGAARGGLRDQGRRAALHRRAERGRQVDPFERPHRRQALGQRRHLVLHACGRARAKG